MATKTFTPAFRAKVGDWEYYVCVMSYGQVAREVAFHYELKGNPELGDMLQRGLGVRTDSIRDYLLNNSHRFLGAMIVAAWGGAPEYVPLEMADTEDNILSGVDRDFGVLSFDGAQQYFALDGQHRLRAIKDAIKKDPDLANEDITVLVVPHFDDEGGRQKTRRLFTNLNRNAVKTTAQENIALDEDDGFAIMTRRLIDEHPFFGKDGVIQVRGGGKPDANGMLRLATAQVTGSTNPAFTTIGVLYDLLWELRFELHGSMEKREQRATDEVLDASYDTLGARMVEILKATGDLYDKYEASATPWTLRATKGNEGAGHPMMRPVVQKAVLRILRNVVGEQELLSWKDALARLSALDWRMKSAPFRAVWLETPDAKAEGKMATGKDNADLLFDLLLVHVAPATKAQITRALSNYRQIKGKAYPLKADDLVGNIVTKD